MWRLLIASTCLRRRLVQIIWIVTQTVLENSDHPWWHHRSGSHNSMCCLVSPPQTLRMTHSRFHGLMNSEGKCLRSWVQIFVESPTLLIRILTVSNKVIRSKSESFPLGGEAWQEVVWWNFSSAWGQTSLSVKMSSQTDRRRQAAPSVLSINLLCR